MPGHHFKFESPLELEIKLHYASLEQDSGPWDTKRIDALCRLLKLTRRELAALARVAPKLLIEPIQFVPLSKPARLLLLLIERSAHSTFLGKEHTHSVFPQLNTP